MDMAVHVTQCYLLKEINQQEKETKDWMRGEGKKWGRKALRRPKGREGVTDPPGQACTPCCPESRPPSAHCGCCWCHGLQTAGAVPPRSKSPLWTVLNRLGWYRCESPLFCQPAWQRKRKLIRRSGPCIVIFLEASFYGALSPSKLSVPSTKSQGEQSGHLQRYTFWEWVMVQGGKSQNNLSCMSKGFRAPGIVK